MRDMEVRMWRKKSYDDVKLQIQINMIIGLALIEAL